MVEGLSFISSPSNAFITFAFLISDLAPIKPGQYFGIEEFSRVRKSQVDIGYQLLLVHVENDAVAGILVLRMFHTIEMLKAPVDTTRHQ